MNNFHVVNYHITNRCNYHCIYCFGKFDGQRDPSLEDAKSVIDSIVGYFSENRLKGRINFAGGEPTLYKHLDELIDYVFSLGAKTSVVTNASMITPERIRSWKSKVSCIGLSIDSLSHDANLRIGRCCGNSTVSLPMLIKLANTMHECDIDLKINTVVSALNTNEDLSLLYQALKPKRIKLFQMHIVDGINECAKPYKIIRSEFDAFCNRHGAFQSILVAEPCGSMENSYLMVNPKGEFQLNTDGKYQSFGNLKHSSLREILEKAPLDPARFDLRYTKEVLV